MSRSHMDMSNNAEGYSFPSSPLVVDENHPCSSPCKAKFLTGNSAVKPNSKDAAFPPTKAELVGAARFRNTIEIRTRIDGHNSGRVYHLKAESEDECLRAGLRLSELRQRGAAADGGWYPPGGDPGQLQGRLPVPTRAGLHSASHCCGEEQPSIPLLL